MHFKFVTTLILVLCFSKTEAMLWNGEKASTEQFPATVSLMKHDYHFCTAAKVGEFLYLTAAHCVDGLSLEEKVTLHQGVDLYKKEAPDRKRQEVSLKKVWIHPEYNDEKGPDVAFLQLEAKDENRTSFIEIAKIHTDPLSVGEEVVMAGYGKTSHMESNFPQSLNYGLNKISEVRGYEYIIKGTNYLEPKKGEPAVLDHGDSGGALFLASDSNHLTIVGVNSSRLFWLESSIVRLDNKANKNIYDWMINIFKSTKTNKL